MVKVYEKPEDGAVSHSKCSHFRHLLFSMRRLLLNVWTTQVQCYECIVMCKVYPCDAGR